MNQLFCNFQLRTELKIFNPNHHFGLNRYTIYDPKSDISYQLGKLELSVAQLFNGKRNLDEIMYSLYKEYKISLSREKLQNFQQRLVNLGLLVCATDPLSSKHLDPALGINYGPLKKFLMIPLLRFEPEWLIEKIYSIFFKYFFIRICVMIGFLLPFIAAVIVIEKWNLFWNNVITVYGKSADWLIWHYPIIVISILFHEFGHALACRHYHVRITEMGTAIYLLFATGWARPLQQDWTQLSRQQRLITIMMGPYFSVIFSALGALLWLMAPIPGYLNILAIVMIISPLIALIPTLLPIFNGDTYLALTEWFGIPRLRQESFRYVKNSFRKSIASQKQSLTLQRKFLYSLVVASTFIGWITVWFFTLRLLLTLF